MFKRSLITILLAIGVPALAEEASPLFLDELETLAQFEETDVLKQSVRDYYAKDPSLATGKYPSLLHDAAIFGMSHLLKHLIVNGPHHFDYAYVDGPTPLGYIAGDNQLEAAKILLEAGASPNNSGNTKGIYPLSSAVISGNMKMIELLLKYGAIIHIGSYYQSPLGITLEKNDVEILQLFVTTDFKLDSSDPELRILLIEYLNSDLVEEDVLRILIRHGVDIYAKGKDNNSFMEEYGKLINHSDVKQMLEDVYVEFHLTEQRQTNKEETVKQNTTNTETNINEDPTSSSEEADDLKDALSSYMSDLDDVSASSVNEAEKKAAEVSINSNEKVESIDDGEAFTFSEEDSQNTELFTTNTTDLDNAEVTKTDLDDAVKTTVEESTHSINHDRMENSESDEEQAELSEVNTQNTAETSTTSATDMGSTEGMTHGESVDAKVDANNETKTIIEKTEESSKVHATQREITTESISSEATQSDSDVNSTINTQPE